MSDILNQINSYDFYVKVGPLLPAKAYVDVIENTKEYSELLKRIKSDKLKNKEIKEFVDKKSEKIEGGKHSSLNIPFSVLACALKEVDNDFSEEYLTDLAELNSAELGFASRVADYCLELKES